VETHPKPNSWVLAIRLPLSLLLVFACASLLSRYRASGNAQAAQRHARLSVSALDPKFSKSTHRSPNPKLLFDPVLVYSTYLSGPSTAEIVDTSVQSGKVIQTDASGDLYVAGSTNSPSFPVTTGALESKNSQRNVLGFLAKIDPTGQTLLFSTYIDGIQGVSAMVVDPNGDIYLAGPAAPGDLSFPALPIPSGSTPFVSTPRSIGILKLNPTATTVLAATYLGGSANDSVAGVALKPGTSGSNLYITGTTGSNDFQTTQAQAPVLQSSLGSSSNLFVTVLDPTLSSAIYSTYLGQASSASNFGGPRAIAVDTAGDAYVVGGGNPGFPTSGGALQASCPDFCSFVAELNPTGSALLHSTYFGSGGGSADAVAVDSSQNIYIEGHASLSTTIPTMNPVPGFYPCSTPNGFSGFISEISAAGTLAFSSCVASPSSTIFIDGSGNISIAGTAYSGFPLHNPIQSNTSTNGSGDGYVATVDPTNGSLVFSSFLGDGLGGTPTINDVAVDPSGNVYVAGYGYSFPVFNALQPLPSGGDPGSQCANPCGIGANVEIMKIAPSNAPAAGLSPASLTFPVQSIGAQSAAQTATVIDMGSNALNVSNVTASGDFSVQDGCTAPVAAAGGTCALQVTFTPTSTGTRTGSLTITDNSDGSPHTVQLTGVGGQASASLSPSSLSFSEAINTTATLPVMLTNSGTLALPISSVQTSGATFSETNNCGTSVGAGSSCEIDVSFSPTALGNFTGTLTVTDGASASPQTVSLTGAGVAANIGLAFVQNQPSFYKGAAGTGGITLIQVGGQGLSGSVSFNCSGLPQGASCTFSPTTVTMKPNASTQVQLAINTTARSFLFVPIGVITTLLLFAILTGVNWYRNAPINSMCPMRLRWRLVPLFALAICACGGGASSSSNGGSSSSGGTPAGVSQVVITATSGSATQTVNFTLSVQ